MLRHQVLKKHKGVHAGKVVVAITGGLVLATVIGLGFGFLVKFLWNATLAVAFDISVITYWQAVGMFILAKIFFSIGRHGKEQGQDKIDRKIHQWIGVASDEDVQLPDDADAFKQYWQEEGKQAYQEYLENRKGRSQDEGRTKE